MAVSAEKRSSRVRRQASKKQRKNRTVQVRFSDEELAALDAVCESTGMTRSAVLRSWTVPGEGAGSNPVYVVTKNADAERLAMEARRIGVNVNQIARTLNAEAKGRDAKDPVSRMMADMTAMMLRVLIQQAVEEQRRRERDAAPFPVGQWISGAGT